MFVVWPCRCWRARDLRETKYGVGFPLSLSSVSEFAPTSRYLASFFPLVFPVLVSLTVNQRRRVGGVRVPRCFVVGEIREKRGKKERTLSCVRPSATGVVKPKTPS